MRPDEVLANIDDVDWIRRSGEEVIDHLLSACRRGDGALLTVVDVFCLANVLIAKGIGGASLGDHVRAAQVADLNRSINLAGSKPVIYPGAPDRG